MAVRIDASGDSLQRTANLPTSGAWSACCWWYYVATSGSYAAIVALENGGTYQFFGNAGGNFGVEVSGIGGTAFSTNPTVSNWYFMAVISNGTNVIGYKRTLAGVWETASATANSFTPATLTFGNDISSEYNDCRLAGIKVWSAALSAAEINQEAETLRPQRTANLNLFCPCWPGATERLADYSGNGYNLTAGGTLTDEDAPPTSYGAPAWFNPQVTGPFTDSVPLVNMDVLSFPRSILQAIPGGY
jgi:hypothetical protein